MRDVIKTKTQRDRIQKACNITDKIFSKIIKNFKKFQTEVDLEKFIYYEIQKSGCVPSFPCIVAAGKNAAEPHHIPTEGKLKGFVVIDFGVFYQGFASDMTRTVYVGKPNKTEKEVYGLVLKAELDAINIIKAGVKCSEPDILAREVLGNKWNKEFIHTLGHGLGRRIHEHPKIYKTSRFYFKKDMMITVEPGVYVKGKFGIRIEDTCHVTETHCEIFTKSTKELLIFS